MSSLYERKKALEERASGGVTSSGISSDDIKDLIAAGRKRQNEILSEYRAKSTEKNSTPSGRFGGSSLSAPKTETSSLSQPTFSEREALRRSSEEFVRSTGAPARDFFRRELGSLGTFLFGESEDLFRGKSLREKPDNEGMISSIQGELKARGVFRFLYQNSFKEESERVLEGAAVLNQQGYDRSEATNLATQYYQQGEDTVPENVRLTLKSNDLTTKAWTAVEVLDFSPFLSRFTKTAGKTFVRETLKQSMLANNATEARRILAEAFPKIEGTRELDELVQISRTLRDPVEGDRFLSEVMELGQRTPVETTTQAQRVFYENGIPVLRGAAETPARELVQLRDEIRTILRGGREETRLSNADILADEIKAGSLPFESTVDDTVDVFFRSGDAGGVGTRVSLSRDLAESLGEGTTRSFRANVDDLVRLDDGTFVYAPKKQLSSNLEPQITQIRQAQRQRVKDIETVRAQEAEADRLLRIEEAKAQEAARTKARQEQVRQVAKAKETLVSSKGLADRRVATIRADAQKRIAEVRETTKAASKEATAARQSVDRLVAQVGKKSREVSKLRDKYRTRIDAVKNRTRLTGKQKNELRASLRKERDKAIEAIEKKYAKLGKDLEKARTKLSKAEENVSRLPNRDEAIAAIKQDTKQAVEDVTQASKAEIAEARRVIDEGGEVGEAAKAEMRKPAVVRAGEEVTETIEKSGIYTTEFSGSAFDTATGAIKPINSEGRKAISLISKKIVDEGNAALVRAGGKPELMPQEYRVATNKAQIENAVERVYQNPEKAYNDYMNVPAGKLDDTSNAALALALRQHEYVKGNLSRARLLEQRFASEGTRIAQELQARVMLGSQDKGAILSRLFNKTDELLKGRVKNVDVEIANLKKELGEEWENLATASKDDVLDYINTNICT